MKLSDAIAEYLVQNGVRVVFGYQGGSITHMIDSFDKKGIQYIQTYNEQGASLAADAYARIAEQGLGVAIGTNGPGATNMLTGIANAYCDSVPVLFLTGQVHTFAMKKSSDIRQESFQEIDILSMVHSITKYAVTVMRKEDAIPEIAKAISIAKCGRPGPVLIDLPVDIQGQDLEEVPNPILRKDKMEYDMKSIPFELIEEILCKAKRPLILAGGGIRAAHAVDIFREYVQKTDIPVVCSLMGLDVLEHDNQNFIGFIGGYGNRYANLAVQRADAILVLGSRLDMRQTGKRKDLFAQNAKIIHIDIDEVELNHFIQENISVHCDIKLFLEKMILDSGEKRNQSLEAWKQQIDLWKEKYSAESELENASINPNVFISTFGRSMMPDSIVTCDVGQNQMWVAQSLRLCGHDARILNSGGLGTMGYALPASIGAYYAEPQKNIYAFMGDGGLQMNIQELEVIGQYKLPIKIIVLNNHSLGLIRDIHEKYYQKRYVGSVDGFDMPDLSFLAKAYHLSYRKIDSLTCHDVGEFINNRIPEIIEVELTNETYVWPELLGNDGLDCQRPYKDVDICC